VENRLVRIGYKADPQKSTEFKYDGWGRRLVTIEKTGNASKETRHAWCGPRVCQTRDSNDTPIAYHFAEGSYYPVFGKRHFYMRDHLGSVRDVLDQTGAKIASYDYDPYGNLMNNPQTPPEFGFAGMQYHAQSGLYLTMYRVYDPQTGRWLSKDPILEEGGFNLYAYVEGDPLNYIDPLGLWGFGDPLPQGFVDFWAGFGDTLSFGITDSIRDQLDTNGAVDKCSGAYAGGTYTGYGWFMALGSGAGYRFYKAGKELSFGKNFRIAPLGNRTGHPTGRFPHYHRRGIDPATGQTKPGQGIGRHRPWDTRSTDKSRWERF
jgi:RHS repeat-associated protein